MYDSLREREKTERETFLFTTHQFKKTSTTFMPSGSFFLPNPSSVAYLGLQQQPFKQGTQALRCKPFLRKPLQSTQAVQPALKTAVWPLAAMPITVALCFSQTLPWQAQLLKKALQAWQRASQGVIYFELKEPFNASKPFAFIRIEESATPPEAFPTLLGQAANTIVEEGVIQQSCITLFLPNLLSPSFSTSQQQHRFYSTLLHELGHALGLEHSPEPNDCMHPNGLRNTGLSPNDALRLQRLYPPNP
jgi:Matrixin